MDLIDLLDQVEPRVGPVQAIEEAIAFIQKHTMDGAPNATRTRLAAPMERGLVSEIGTSPQDPRRRYFRVENA